MRRVVATDDRAGGPDAAPADRRSEAALEISEAFLRDLIAESFGLQRLDVLVGRVLGAAEGAARRPPRRSPPRRHCDLDSSIVAFGAGEEPRGGIVSLGNKGVHARPAHAPGLPRAERLRPHHGPRPRTPSGARGPGGHPAAGGRAHPRPRSRAWSVWPDAPRGPDAARSCCRCAAGRRSSMPGMLESVPQRRHQRRRSPRAWPRRRGTRGRPGTPTGASCSSGG